MPRLTTAQKKAAEAAAKTEKPAVDAASNPPPPVETPPETPTNPQPDAEEDEQPAEDGDENPAAPAKEHLPPPPEEDAANDTPPPPPAGIVLAEVRISIHGFSAHGSVMKVTGPRHRGQYSFHRSNERGGYERRYVVGGNDPDRGIFPLELFIAEVPDIVASPFPPPSMKFKVEFLTPEQYAAQEAVTERKRREVIESEQQQREAVRVLEAQQEEAAKLADKIIDGEVAPAVVLSDKPKPGAGGLAALAAQAGIKT